MTIARDRLRLRDFTPLEQEFDLAKQLDELVGRFAIDASGHIVKLYIGKMLTDPHVQLVQGLRRLQFFTGVNHPRSASGISNTGMAALLSHPALVDVIYQGNERLTGTFFSIVANSPSLKRLGLPYCLIDDAGLALAVDCSLTHLSLRGSKISDASVGALCSMRFLQQLHVAETDVTTSAVLRFRDKVPDCWIDILDHPSERKPVA